jgi:hypothetical protein
MDGSFAARSDDEQDVSEIDTALDAQSRNRAALRDRLIRRVFDEEFLLFAEKDRDDALYLVGFETDPIRIWNRLGFDFRARVIRERIERINKLAALSLKPGEFIGTHNHSLQAFVAAARHDWKRGKIQLRAELRRSHKHTGHHDIEEVLWQQIR